MWGTHLLPWLSGPLWLGVGAPDWALSMGQIELNCVLNTKQNRLKWNCFGIEIVPTPN